MSAPNPHPKPNQNIRCQQEKQQHPLKHLDRGFRQSKFRLYNITADISNRQQHPRQHDAKRMQPPQKRYDNRGKAIAQWKRRG